MQRSQLINPGRIPTPFFLSETLPCGPEALPLVLAPYPSLFRLWGPQEMAPSQLHGLLSPLVPEGVTELSGVRTQFSEKPRVWSYSSHWSRRLPTPIVSRSSWFRRNPRQELSIRTFKNMILKSQE